MAKTPTRPRDPNQLAKLIAELATGEAPQKFMTEDGRDAAAVALGRRGGLIGGRVRAQRLSPEERKRIAEKAARARWDKKV